MTQHLGVRLTGFPRTWYGPQLMNTVFCLLVLLTFAAPAFAAPEPAEKVPVVFIDTAKKTKLFDELTYPARIIPMVEANVLSEGDGVVSRIASPLGQAIRRGQTILTIKNTDPVYQYAPLNVIAPVSGVVSSVEVTAGAWVVKGQKLATVVDPKKVKIGIEIGGEDLASVKPGMQGELAIPGEEKPVKVKVIGISPFVDRSTGTAACELVPVSKNEEMKVVPGLIGKVSFRVREHDGFQIPEVAVVYRGDTTYLRLVEKDSAKLVPVSVGEMRKGMVEIVKGLQAGAKYVLRTSTFVADGEKVEVQSAEAATP